MPSRKVDIGKVEDTGIPAAWMHAQFSDLRICGIQTGKLNSITGRPLVHWRIQGTVPSMIGALVFDTMKDEVTTLIDIGVRPINHFVSTAQVASYDLNLSYSMSGAQLVKFIEAKSLQYCSYNGEGSGCWTWCEGVAMALAETGYVEGGVPRVQQMQQWYRQLPISYPGYWFPSEGGASFRVMNWQMLP